MTTCLLSDGHVLQQRTKEVKQSLCYPLPEWAFYPQTGIKQAGTRNIIILHGGEIAAESGIVNDQRDFKIEPQTAHIQVNGTDQAQLAIDQYALGVKPAAFELINLNASCQQLSEIGPACPANQQGIILTWKNDTDVDPALCCRTNCMQQIVAGNKVGRCHN